MSAKDNPLVDAPGEQDAETQDQPQEPDTGTEAPQEPDTGPLTIPTPPSEPGEDAITGPTTIPDEQREDLTEEERQQRESQPSETPESIEKRSRSAEQRFARYGKGIEELYADTEARLYECPLCPSQHKGYVDLNFAGLIPDEIADAVKGYLGMARPIAYKPSPRYRTCPECDGEGKVATGSHVPDKQTAQCEGCQGRGYESTTGQPISNGHTGLTGPTVENFEQAFTSNDEVDSWGEPRLLPDGRENPNFGRMPNHKVLVEPWGVTANLTAFDQVPGA